MFLVLIIHSISLKETSSERLRRLRQLQDRPGASLRTHIPSFLAHSRCNAVRHVNCLHNARSITKRLGTRQDTERDNLCTLYCGNGQG